MSESSGLHVTGIALAETVNPSIHCCVYLGIFFPVARSVMRDTDTFILELDLTVYKCNSLQALVL